MSESAESQSTQYVYQLWSDLMHWYDSADTKAQVVVGLNGAFLAFLTGILFSKPDDLIPIIARFNVVTYILTACMIVTLFSSVAMAIRCMRSNLYSEPEIVEMIQQNTVDDLYRPSKIIWFFQLVRHLDAQNYVSTIQSLDANAVIQVLGEQIIIVSGNVTKKHLLANRGFSLSALTFVLFFLSAISYVIPVVVSR